MVAVLVLFGMLFLCLFVEIYSLYKRSLDWYGEDSILQTSRTYRAVFFSPFDTLQGLLIFLGVLLFIIAFFRIGNNDLYAKILVSFVAFASLVVPFMYFRIKYQYWQQNRWKDYTFDPILRVVSIVGVRVETFSFDDIQVIQQYVATNSKFTQGYIKILFKDKRPPVFLTPLLPCYAILPDFFVGV